MKHELASRTTATGERVTLFWYARSGRVALEVAGPADEAPALAVFVDPDRALEAFRHPFVHVRPLTAASAA